MREEYHLDGGGYMRNRDELKILLKKHGLRWVGDGQETFVWSGDGEKLEAFYERDEGGTRTISARLVWSGNGDGPFLAEFRAWAKVAGGRISLVPVNIVPTPADTEWLRQEMALWDMVYRPSEESGRPKKWIDYDMDEYRTRRTAKEQELLASRTGRRF